MSERHKGDRAEDYLCDLNILYAVIAILEGGTIRTPQGQRVAYAIINKCKAGAETALRQYDRINAEDRRQG